MLAFTCTRSLGWLRQSALFSPLRGNLLRKLCYPQACFATCVFAKHNRQGSQKCFCKKLFGIRRASGISSVFFTYPKFPPIKHQKIDKIFLDFHSYTSLSQKDFFRLFYSVFCVSKPIPIKHHDFYSCVSEDRFFAHLYSLAS